MGDQPRYPLRRFAVSLLPFRIGLFPEPVADPAVGETVEERLQRLVGQVVGPGLLDRRGRGAEALGQRDGLLIVGILLQQSIDLFEREALRETERFSGPPQAVRSSAKPASRVWGFMIRAFGGFGPERDAVSQLRRIRSGVDSCS